MTKPSIAVIKYGGNAMTDVHLKQCFAQDIAYLQSQGIAPIVVHGGGPQISTALEQAGHEVQFINGERVTDLQTLEIVEMVLCGNVNKHIVELIQNYDALAVGISGKDAKLLLAEVDPKKKQLGHVGRITDVNPQLVQTLLAQNFIPVIAPVSTSVDGTTYNVNADFAASAIASAIGAEHLLLLSNIPGVLDKEGNIIRELTKDKVEAYVADGTINEGMLPKILCALEALAKGVKNVAIIDGRVEHIIRDTLVNQRVNGTQIH